MENSKWIRVKDFKLEESRYYHAIRYGIHIYPDTVCYRYGQFYSTKERKVVDDVAFLMKLEPHPFDDGSGMLIDFKKQ